MGGGGRRGERERERVERERETESIICVRTRVYACVYHVRVSVCITQKHMDAKHEFTFHSHA